MLSVFWGSKDVIHTEKLNKRTTINSVHYAEIPERLKSMKEKNVSDETLNKHDNAQNLITAGITMRTIEPLGFQVIPHPLYSP